MITFTIPLLPEPKQADRQHIVTTRLGRQFIAHYQPKAKMEKAMMEFASMHRPDKPLQGPVLLEAIFRFPWNKSHSKRFRAKASAAKDTKPDLDNLEKLLCDVIEKTGFITNDSQIAEKRTSKVWTDQGGIDVSITETT